MKAIQVLTNLFDETVLILYLYECGISCKHFFHETKQASTNYFKLQIVHYV